MNGCIFERKVLFCFEDQFSFLIVLPPVWKSDVKCTRISGIFNKSNLVMENGLFPVIRASQASCPCSRSHPRSDSGASRLVRLDCDLDLQAFSRSSSIFARVRWRAQGLRCHRPLKRSFRQARPAAVSCGMKETDWSICHQHWGKFDTSPGTRERDERLFLGEFRPTGVSFVGRPRRHTDTPSGVARALVIRA